jgi:hypothetical protein
MEEPERRAKQREQITDLMHHLYFLLPIIAAQQESAA